MSKLRWFSQSTKMRRYMMMYNGGLDYVSFQDHKDHLRDVEITQRCYQCFVDGSKISYMLLAGIGLNDEEFMDFMQDMKNF